MAKLNRTCGICKKKYSYCPSCAADAKKPTWMAIFCCDNCRDLYNVLNDYSNKHLAKEQAFKLLGNLDLSCKNKLPEYYQISVDEILEFGKEKEKKRSYKMNKMIKKNATENEVVENKIKDVLVETIELEKIDSENSTKAIDVISESENKDNDVE